MEERKLQISISKEVKALAAAAGIKDVELFADMLRFALDDRSIILTEGRLGSMQGRDGFGYLLPQLIRVLHDVGISDPTITDYIALTNVRLERYNEKDNNE